MSKIYTKLKKKHNSKFNCRLNLYENKIKIEEKCNQQNTNQEEMGLAEARWVRSKLKYGCCMIDSNRSFDNMPPNVQNASDQVPNQIEQLHRSNSKASLCEMIWNRLIYSSVTDSNR